MVPTAEQIQVAAYHRWRCRGDAHGRDWDDWFAAEQDLLFTFNYEILARRRLDGIAPVVLGDDDAPTCRFCEQAAPRARFSTAHAPAVPEFMGNTALRTREDCEDCRALAREAIEPELDEFTRPFRIGEVRGGRDGSTLTDRPRCPVGAYKGLVRMALAVMPEQELPSFGDTLEWVGNPDHGLDAGAFGDLTCCIGLTSDPSPFSWLALAKRSNDDLPMPYMLFFAGTGHAVFQVHLPLCVRDEDLDGEALIVPRAASPFGAGRVAAESIRVLVPIGSREPGRRARAAMVGS